MKNTPPLHSEPKRINSALSDTSSSRIYEIDALRGIVLFGILLVHASNLFGFKSSLFLDNFSPLGVKLNSFLNLFLANKCAPVFNILFGVSFYLILKNPAYSSGKFIWRCLLLITIGIFNKLFYTYDALMWYGFWGIALVAFRYLKPKMLLFYSILFYLLGCFLSLFAFGNFLPINESPRYYFGVDLYEIIKYPIIDVVMEYLRVVFNSGIFRTLGLMIFGYWIAKSGLIYNFKQWAVPRNVLITLILYGITFGLSQKIYNPFLQYSSIVFGFGFYSIFFLYLYGKLKKRLIFLESYGRMGLTNYSIQGIFGIISLTTYLLPNQFDFTFILAYFLFFYLVQCIFSYYWLKIFKYGPMEYIWRSLVNLKFSNPFISKSPKIASAL